MSSFVDHILLRKKKKMKKLLIILTLLLIITSCKSSKPNCDSYGQIKPTIQRSI